MPPSSLLSMDGLIKLRMQRVCIGALCRQMSSCNQSERDAIFGRDSYERKLSNHHDQGRRQGATAIIDFFLRNAHVKKFVRGQGAPCGCRRGAPVPWHNGQSKPEGFLLVCYSNFVPKMRRLLDIRLQKYRENGVRGPSRSLEMSPFDRARITSY